MPDPRWTGPPEAIALIFEMGSPAPVIANSAAWVAETVNKELSEGISQANTASVALQWHGEGAASSSLVAEALNAGLQTLAGWTAHKITVAQAAIEAFGVARSSIIPSLVSVANRSETATLHGTNFLGINTPAIIEREVEYYGEHWPHNSSVGWAYSAALTALIALLAVPPPIAPPGASPTAAAAAAQTVGEAMGRQGMNAALQASGASPESAGEAASGSAQMSSQLGSFVQQPLQMATGAIDSLKQTVQAPAQSLQNLPGLAQGMLQSMGRGFPSAAPANVSASSAVGPTIGGSPAGNLPGVGLTSYTKPASGFEQDSVARPTGLRAGVLNAAEIRSPVTTTGTSASLPVAPTGLLSRGAAQSDKPVSRSRVIVEQDSAERH